MPASEARAHSDFDTRALVCTLVALGLLAPGGGANTYRLTEAGAALVARA